MSTELITTQDMNKYNPVLAEQLGLKSGYEGPVNTLPVLKINKDFDDDEGNTLPPGTFRLRVYEEQEDGSSVPVDYYSAKGEEIEIQIFANFYQIQHYDQRLPEGQRFVNKTVLVPDFFSRELIDEQGGTRCGKIPAKQRENYTEAELEEDRKTKQTYRFIYGKVRMKKAVLKTGEETSVDWTPFSMRLRGVNFMPVGELLESIQKQSKMAYNYIFTANLERHKNGDVVFYEIVWDVDMSKSVAVTEEDGKLMEKFIETIRAENEGVQKKYDAALKREDKGTAKKEYLELEASANESNLEDEIPL